MLSIRWKDGTITEAPGGRIRLGGDVRRREGRVSPRGVAGALIDAAVSHANGRGARVIEDYPVDVARRKKVSSAGLYHGAVTHFERARFAADARPIPGRALVTLRN